MKKPTDSLIVSGSKGASFHVSDLQRTLMYSGFVAFATAIIDVLGQEGLTWKTALKLVLTTTLTGLMIAVQKYFRDTREVDRDTPKPTRSRK